MTVVREGLRACYMVEKWLGRFKLAKEKGKLSERSREGEWLPAAVCSNNVLLRFQKTHRCRRYHFMKSEWCILSELFDQGDFRAGSLRKERSWKGSNRQETANSFFAGVKCAKNFK